MSGEEIRAARLARGMSQADLAEALGASPAAVSGWERGLYRPSAEAEGRLRLFFSAGARTREPLPRSPVSIEPGDRFGELEALERLAPRPEDHNLSPHDRNARWRCLCHLCGQECLKAESNLPKNRSCGSRACTRKVRERAKPEQRERLEIFEDPAAEEIRIGFVAALAQWLQQSGRSVAALEDALRLRAGSLDRWARRYPAAWLKGEGKLEEAPAQPAYVPVGSGFVDLTGQRFGGILVLGRAGKSARGAAMWHVRCDCGREYQARGTALRHYRWSRCGECARGRK